jgi:hypothetical protein
MLGPARLQAQPFDLVFVDNADLSPIVLVPLSVLFPHLGYGPAVESDGLNLGHVGGFQCQSVALSKRRHALSQRNCAKLASRQQLSGLYGRFHASALALIDAGTVWHKQIALRGTD